MSLPKSFTTVTTLSKTLAAILFITLPFMGFYLGMEYEKKINPQTTYLTPLNVSPTPAIYTSPPVIPTGIPTQLPPQNPVDEDVVCTQEAKLCSDGSYVGRTGPKCEFTKCPGE